MIEETLLEMDLLKDGLSFSEGKIFFSLIYLLYNLTFVWIPQATLIHNLSRPLRPFDLYFIHIILKEYLSIVINFLS